MSAYPGLVAFYCFFVDYLLLIGTNRLCGYPTGWGRTAAAAAFGAVYSILCMMPRLHFISNLIWRIVFLGILSLIAFGLNRSAIRRGSLFILLSMALGGIALGMETSGGISIAVASAVLCILCWVGFRDRPGSVTYVPVELSYGGKHIHLTALRDTGNMLRDPLTGAPVLVVGADVARALTGLSQEQLQAPISVMEQATIPGLRLIPYRTVGQPAGMLLAMRLTNVRIGKWRGSSLVAFAPEGFDKEGNYQALTGGAA